MGQPAEAGNAEAMLTAYYDIIRPETDSFKYLLRSGELGCAEAYYHLMMAFAASELSHDYGMPIDDTVDLRAEELKWAKKGAESNSLRARDCQYELAVYYRENRDMNEYQRYLTMAASNGHRTAQLLNESQKKQPAGKGGGCYIATAVYGSYDAPEVLVLRRFRD